MTNDQIKSGGELMMMRQSAGMKAKDLAAALDISPEHLSRMEQGTKPVSRVMELAIRTVLSRTPSHGRVSGELGDCPFCQFKLHLDAENIEGWIANVACTGCDMRGPISEWKHDDIEEAKADGLARWHAAWKSRVPSCGTVSDTLAVTDWMRRNADRRNPEAFINTDPAYFASEMASAIAALSTPAENGEPLPVTIGGTGAKFAKDAAPIPVEGEVKQRHRDKAGELWKALDLGTPEPHDGTAAVALETMARFFADAEAEVPTFSRGVDEEAILWAAHSAICDVGFANEKPSPAQYSEAVRNALIAALSAIEEPRG